MLAEEGVLALLVQGGWEDGSGIELKRRMNNVYSVVSQKKLGGI